MGHTRTLLLILALMFALRTESAAQTPTGQPPPVPHPASGHADCLSCHADKTKGKVIHPALQFGCAACHRVNTDTDTSGATLPTPREQICFSCHIRSDDAQQHAPYAKGQCVRCHDPHSAPYPNMLKAQGNALCQDCHEKQHKSGSCLGCHAPHSAPTKNLVRKVDENAGRLHIGKAN